jgi:hypothetical protein
LVQSATCRHSVSCRLVKRQGRLCSTKGLSSLSYLISVDLRVAAATFGSDYPTVCDPRCDWLPSTSAARGFTGETVGTGAAPTPRKRTWFIYGLGIDRFSRLSGEPRQAVSTCRRHECAECSPSSRRALNPAATETSVALCRVAATPGSAGGFSQSMEAEMESRAKRRRRAGVHQYGLAHVSRRRSLLGVQASLHWPR